MSRLPESFLTLETTASLVERYRTVEAALFATLGQWARHPGDPSVKLLFAVAARRHGRNAGEWNAVAPRVAAFVPGNATSVDPLVVALGRLASPAARLAGYREAVNTLSDRYRDHRDRCSPVGDGPFAALLEAVEASSRQAAAAATEVLDALGGTIDERRKAEATVAGALGAEWPQTG